MIDRNAERVEVLEERVAGLLEEIHHLEDELCEREEALSELSARPTQATSDVPPIDSELYSRVYQPLFEAWRASTGDAYQPDLEELADFYIERLRELDDLNDAIENPKLDDED